jgi:hypothetical protein
MAIATTDDLQDFLDEALSWRRVEMHALKGAVSAATAAGAGTPLARAMSRAGITLLYAHWEGYVREACKAYLSFVAKRRIRSSELNDGLLLTMLAALHRRMESGDDDARETMIELVRSGGAPRARLPRDVVNTRSNLRHSVVEEVLSGVGLDSARFQTKAHLIDKSLCDSRNSIAHGRELFPSASDFEDLHSEVLRMMEDVRDHILSEARSSGYLVANS